MTRLARRCLSAFVSKLSTAYGRILARVLWGSGAPSGGLATVRVVPVLASVGAVAASVLAFSVVPAFAAYQHPFLSQLQLPNSSFAYSVAVDEVSGDTLVAASGPDVVYVYSSSGSLVATWNGSASANPPGMPAGSFGGGQVTVAANDTTGDVYVTDSTDGVVDILSSSGAYLGQLTGATFSSGPSRTSLADTLGVAVDQATGNIYVADQGAGVVDVFNSAGAFTGTLTGRSLTNAFSVAVDDHSGTVLVAEGHGSDVVDVFSAATGAYQSTWNGSAASNPPGTPAGSFGAGNGYVQVGVDSATGQVYVGDGVNGVVDELDSSGNYLGQLTGTPSGPFGRGEYVLGVGVGQASGDLYVADIFNNAVDVFGNVLVPDVTTGAPSSVTTASARLNGVVNPDGVALTDCHFDYGTDTSYASGSVSCLDSGGNSVVGNSGSTAIAVHADVSGLQSGRTYHFRLVAANVQGANAGQDVAFGSPTLGTTFADAVGPTSVTLHAQVNPQGLDTTYRFEYGTTTSYGQSVPVPDADIGAGGSAVAVTQTPTGLQPNATYHYRVVGSNSAGSVSGPDGTFATSPAALIDVQPPTGMATATGLSNGTASLHAYIDPQGSDTSYHFEYGTTTGYGSSTAGQDAGAGNAPTLQSAQISALQGGTTYHYRTVVSNAYGSYDGPDSTVTTPPSSCPNQQFRTGASARLPDCRAYEQVSPQDKNGYPAESPMIDSTGDRVGFNAKGAFPGYASGYLQNHYVAQRGSSGWSTVGVDPPSTLGFGGDHYPSADLSASDSIVSFEPNAGPFDSAKQGAFFMRKPDGTFVQASPTLSRTDGGYLGSVNALGLSADLSHVLFFGGVPASHNGSGPPQAGLLAGAPATALYEVVGAGGPSPQLRVASVDQAGKPVAPCGGAAQGLAAASPDGSVVLFNSPDCTQIWARVGGQSTAVISEPSPNAECTTSACKSAPVTPAAFASLSPDGSRAFFLSAQQLTDSASEDASATYTSSNVAASGALTVLECVGTAGPNGCNLYGYDFARPAGHNLVALSAGDVSGSGPEVQAVIGSSDDGSHVYFVAQGVLSTEPNSLGDVARAGADNLYAEDTSTGSVAFVAGLCTGAGQSGSLSGVARCPGAGSDIDSFGTPLPAAVTPDGRFLVFTSYGQLTPDDTESAASVFEYDSLTGSLTRLSVGHDGQGQNGNGGVDAMAVGQRLIGQSGDLEQTGVSADGQTVIFTTAAPLDVRDVNGASDVYEWHQGEVSLVSDGQSPTGVNAATSPPALSASGQDIVFDTDTGLLPQDTDGLGDVYDARIGGGFPAPPTPPAGCSGDACQGQPAGAPPLPSAGSVSFSGPGDVTSGSGTPPARKATVVMHTVRGAQFAITVRVPAAGRVTITGAGLKPSVVFLRHAGSYGLRVALTPAARSTLRHRRKLRLWLHVGYRPAGGLGSSVTVPVMDKA